MNIFLFKTKLNHSKIRNLSMIFQGSFYDLSFPDNSRMGLSKQNNKIENIKSNY